MKTTLKENLTNRVRKLTKPVNSAQALQPFFEAVSNAIMAIDDRSEGATSAVPGRVNIEITNLGADDVEIAIQDNGIGLDAERYEAFCTVDTGYKSERGGKGVGRLYWLDAFREVSVESRYEEDGSIKTRAIQFRLRDQDQIVDIDPFEQWSDGEIGTIVRFRGLRQGAYLAKFPKQADALKNYLAAEFIADFLAGGGPQVRLQLVTKARGRSEFIYHGEIRDLVVDGPTQLSAFEVDETGAFEVKGYLCDGKASRGLNGKHQVHLIGNGRTIESRKVDDLLGISDLKHEDKDQLALHLIVSGEFLDDRIAESRTAFSIPESVLQSIVKSAVSVGKGELIADQIAEFDQARRAAFDQFLTNQPIFSLGNPDELFNSIPTAATDDEAFVRHLAVPRMRAEKNREQRLRELVGAVVSGDKVPEDFPEIVRKAAEGIHQNELSSLAHHAARRRVVLDLLDALIRRVRADADRDDRYHLEKTLHSLLAPMRVVSTDPKHLEGSAHDLWIIDERLAFASGFASDRPLRDFVVDNSDNDRPDLVIWDTQFGLGAVSSQGGDGAVDDVEPLSKVFVVELKHPGRRTYKPEERIEDQVTKYVRALKNGDIEGFGRRNIKVTSDCQFHCFVVADFEGNLRDQVASWDYIYNRRGRRRQLGGEFSNVVIEAVEWDFVLSTARETNRALLDAAGMQGHGLTDFAKAADAAPEIENAAEQPRDEVGEQVLLSPEEPAQSGPPAV